MTIAADAGEAGDAGGMFLDLRLPCGGQFFVRGPALELLSTISVH